MHAADDDERDVGEELRLRVEELYRRAKRDRLAWWTLLGALPVVWFSIAFIDPRFLVLVPLIALVLAAYFRYGPAERFEPEPEDIF
jgi:hypothetical protein